MSQSLKFEISLQILVEYLGWRNTQHPPAVVLELLRLIKGMDTHHIVLAFTEAPAFVPFITKLRQSHGYSWLTAREGVILFNLLLLQNRSTASSLLTQIDTDNEDPNFSARFPQIALYARAKPTVGEPKASSLLVKAAKAIKVREWRRNKRISLQGE